MTDANPQGEADGADFDAQAASARPGGEARGGIDPKDGDAATPQKASAAREGASQAMRDAGFGDDKGADIA